MKQKIINSIANDKFDEYQTLFNINGFVRIENFLESNFLKFLLSEVMDQNFLNAFYVEGSNREASDKAIQDLPNDTKLDLYKAIHEQAANGLGFHYGRSKIVNDNSLQPYSNQYLTELNNIEFINIVRKLTSIQNIHKVDGQITRYRSGDFLTRHNDNVKGENRIIAYVLCLSKDWHPDWGGMLQFYRNNGTPDIPLNPVYNSVVLFDVNKVHSVTNIAQFAPTERYSVTGWMRS
jgi:Rps23 Pro-64 3,4-dihydroxylase Tpa1-like proline 4-hydroxylase